MVIGNTFSFEEGQELGIVNDVFEREGFMTVKSLLAENPDPSEADVRAALSSNLCRCTGYNQMYEAIRSAIAAERASVSASK